MNKGCTGLQSCVEWLGLLIEYINNRVIKKMDDEVVNSHAVDCKCVGHSVVLLVYKSGKVKCASAFSI